MWSYVAIDTTIATQLLHCASFENNATFLNSFVAGRISRQFSSNVHISLSVCYYVLHAEEMLIATSSMMLHALSILVNGQLFCLSCSFLMAEITRVVTTVNNVQRKCREMNGGCKLPWISGKCSHLKHNSKQS